MDTEQKEAQAGVQAMLRCCFAIAYTTMLALSFVLHSPSAPLYLARSRLSLLSFYCTSYSLLTLSAYLFAWVFSALSYISVSLLLASPGVLSSSFLACLSAPLLVMLNLPACDAMQMLASL